MKDDKLDRDASENFEYIDYGFRPIPNLVCWEGVSSIKNFSPPATEGTPRLFERDEDDVSI